MEVEDRREEGGEVNESRFADVELERERGSVGSWWRSEGEGLAMAVMGGKEGLWVFGRGACLVGARNRGRGAKLDETRESCATVIGGHSGGKPPEVLLL